MSSYPNNYIRFASPYRLSGVQAYYKYAGIGGGRFGMFTANISRKTSVPDGYGMLAGPMQPIRAGGMSAYGKPVAALMMTGNALAGGMMSGSGNITFSGDNKLLSLVIAMSGTATITFTADDAVLRLTIGLDGSGSWSLTGDCNLAMIVPFSGVGAMEITWTANMKGIQSMDGIFTPYTELTPQSLAKSVWAAAIDDYTEAGTAGKTLGTIKKNSGLIPALM